MNYLKKNPNQFIDEDGNLHIIDMCFNETIIPNFKSDIQKMLVPVICSRCGKIYDLCDGKVIHRFQDCTLYTTPCCGQNVDDRESGTPAFTRINKEDYL